MVRLKKIIRKYLPGKLINTLRFLLDLYVSIVGVLNFPINMIKFVLTRKETPCSYTETIKRRFDYKHELLPNEFLIKKEMESRDLSSAIENTGLSIGYPAWNLLYYSLFCSLQIYYSHNAIILILNSKKILSKC